MTKLTNKDKEILKLFTLIKERGCLTEDKKISIDYLCAKYPDVFGKQQSFDEYFKKHFVGKYLYRTNDTTKTKEANTYKWDYASVGNYVCTNLNRYLELSTNTYITNVSPSIHQLAHIVQENSHNSYNLENNVCYLPPTLDRMSREEFKKWSHENAEELVDIYRFYNTDREEYVWASTYNIDNVFIGAKKYPDRPLFNCTGDYTDEEVKCGVTYSYPWLVDYWEAMDAYNTKQMKAGYWDRVIDFNVNPKRDKRGRVFKVGMRMFSRVCPLSKGIRKSYAKEKWGWNSAFEYDINASIHRITKSIYDKEWYCADSDIYSRLFNKTFKDEDERFMYKKLAMRLYFSKSPAKVASELVTAYYQEFNADGNETWEQHIAKKESYERLCARTVKEVFNGNCTAETVQPYWDRVREFYGGKSLRNEIFMYESMLMFNALEILEENGVEACCVYDCLLTEYEIDFNAVLREAFKRMLRDIK